MHSQEYTTCRDGSVFTLYVYAKIVILIVVFAQTEAFSQCKPHTEPITVLPQGSQTTLMLKNITENPSETTFQAALFSPSSDSFSVPLCARTNFSFSLYERVQNPEVNGHVAGNLITRHYEAEMLL